MEKSRGRILLVDDDQAITDLVVALLGQEGYAVTTLGDTGQAAVLEATATAQPDCVLLDSADRGGYGDSWRTAAVLASRPHPIPVIMFTAHTRDIEEAVTRRTARSLTARFAAVVSKPFDLAVLLVAVASAVDQARGSTRAVQAV
jgi:two-component system OmpR family response regulator